ncbi:MAG: OmpA family protein [Bacteroidia bacterium]|nr:OmpA family protein [Bacteroidia bacterium]
MKGKFFLFAPILLLYTFIVLPQDEEESVKKKSFCNEITNKKAIALYEKGINKKKYSKPERMEFLRKCVELEPDFAEAWLSAGQEIIVRCKLENAPFAPATPFFMKAIAICPKIHADPYYYIGFDFYEKMQNDSAIRYLELFLNFKDDDPDKFSKDYDHQVKQAKLMIKSAKKENALRKNVPFEPKVVKNICTERDEYLAFVSPDNMYCFFVRKVPAQTQDMVYATDREREVFMIARRDKTGVFDKGEPMYYPFNETTDNQGGCTITIDNKYLYFSMVKHEGGLQPNVDIYVSKNEGEKINESWSEIKKISPLVNDPKYWDSQPSISSDGMTLYFASDRPGGYGGTDIWITKKDPKTGQWSVPVNAGPVINTRGHERTPFIHSDSETLYFSSDGHYGFGGFDIFYSRKKENGEWSEPENIGSPINTPGDEVGFFVSSDAKTGYFCAFDEGNFRGKGPGRYDLYSFELYPEARPNEVTFLKGQIKNGNGEALTGAQVEIRSLSKPEKKDYATVDSLTGEFVAALNLKNRSDVVLIVKKDSVAFNNTIISLKDASFQKPPLSQPLEIKTEKIASNKSFIISNIYYKSNSSELTDDSKKILLLFAEYLKENSQLKIEISGHTDNVGNPKDNLALSNNRAYTVKQLLEEYGVPGKRITAVGYGPNKPIAPNTTEQGRAKNRRTEFKILTE